MLVDQRFQWNQSLGLYQDGKKCSPCLASRSLCCRQSCHRLHSVDLSPMVLGSPVSIYGDSGEDSRGDGDSSEDCLSVMMRGGGGRGVIVTIFLRGVVVLIFVTAEHLVIVVRIV